MAQSRDSDGSNSDGPRQALVAASPGRSSTIRYLVIAIFVALVIAPLLFWGMRGELGRWHEAAFWNAKFAGDLPLALKNIERAIARGGDRSDLLMERAELLMRTGDYGSALAVANVLVDRSRQEQQMQPGDTPLRQRLASLLNMRAYYRAVADRDLTDGLADIEEAFELLGNETDPSMRDTRGYLYYRLGDYQSASVDIAYALPLTKDVIMRALAVWQQLARSGATATADRQKMAHQRRSLREGLGVVYQHHGLIMQQLHRDKAARRDFELAQKYGYDEKQGSL